MGMQPPMGMRPAMAHMAPMAAVPQPAPPADDDEPPAKRAKTEESLVPEEEWLRRFPVRLLLVFMTAVVILLRSGAWSGSIDPDTSDPGW